MTNMSGADRSAPFSRMFYIIYTEYIETSFHFAIQFISLTMEILPYDALIGHEFLKEKQNDFMQC